MSTPERTTKTSWDSYPSNPGNVNANYQTNDKTGGVNNGKNSVAGVMLPIIEPTDAGIIIAFVNKFIIINPR